MKKIGRFLLWPFVLVIAVAIFVGITIAWLCLRKKWAINLSDFFRAHIDYHLYSRRQWYRWDEKRFKKFLSVNDSFQLAFNMLARDVLSGRSLPV